MFSVQVTTRVVLHVDDVVSTVRWWIILLAVIVGLVLLLLLILLMWKVRHDSFCHIFLFTQFLITFICVSKKFKQTRNEEATASSCLNVT